jgi:hypothetical protein
MVSTMAKATTLVLDTWEKKLQDVRGSTELEINNDMGIIASSVISHTTFGNNYKEGQQMFEHMETLVHIFSKAFTNPFFFLPGYRLFLSFTLFLNENATCHIAPCVNMNGPLISLQQNTFWLIMQSSKSSFYM